MLVLFGTLSPNLDARRPLETTLSGASMTAEVQRRPSASAAQASMVLQQVHGRPTRSHPEIGYMLATSGRPARCFRRLAGAKE